MKTKLFLFVPLLFATLVGYAQPTTSFGPKIGVNLTSYKPKADSHDLLTGLNLGLFLNHSINAHFGIMGEVNYTQMGSQVEYKGNIERLHYIQVPISAVYYFGEMGDSFRPKLFAGPYVGFLVGANTKSGTKLVNNVGDPVKEAVDFGGQVGLGFNYRIKNETWLNVDARYMHGFTDITKEASTNFQNMGFGLNVGVSFPLSK